MPTRWINFVLLASIICWATGAAQFVHELVEHGDHDEQKVSLCKDTGGTFGPQANHQIPVGGHREHHDHDDCPTCQMLAHMSAVHIAPPAFLPVHLPAFCTLCPDDWCWPVIESRAFAPIRGPPLAGLALS